MVTCMNCLWGEMVTSVRSVTFDLGELSAERLVVVP